MQNFRKGWKRIRSLPRSRRPSGGRSGESRHPGPGRDVGVGGQRVHPLCRPTAFCRAALPGSHCPPSAWREQVSAPLRLPNSTKLRSQDFGEHVDLWVTHASVVCLKSTITERGRDKKRNLPSTGSLPQLSTKAGAGLDRTNVGSLALWAGLALVCPGPKQWPGVKQSCWDSDCLSSMGRLYCWLQLRPLLSAPHICVLTSEFLLF